MTISAVGAQAQQTQITVSDIRSENGQVILSVFKDEKSYEDEKPFRKKSRLIKNPLKTERWW